MTSCGGSNLPDDLMKGFRSLMGSQGGKRAYRYASELAEQQAVRGERASGLPPLDALMRDGRLTVAEADTVLQGFENAAQKQMTPGPVPGRPEQHADQSRLQPHGGMVA